MSERVVDRSDWAAVSDGLSRLLAGEQTEIEVAGVGFGDQLQAEWVRLLGLAYDPKSDVFEVVVEGLDHIIREPQTLIVQQDGALVRSVVVATKAGDRHILRFREPLNLPQPG